MRVTPDLQGLGVGSWFLGLLESKIKAAGITTIRLSTTGEQKGGIKLYTKMAIPRSIDPSQIKTILWD